MADQPGKAAMTLSEEHYRMLARRRHIDRARDAVLDGRTDEAIEDVLAVLDMLSASEERVIRLHAECVAMLEQAGKILALDASLRPVQITLDPQDIALVRRPDQEPK